MPPATKKPMPMTRLMDSRSPRPQNWLMSTREPTENDELDDIDGYIGHGDGGHLLLTDQTHHEGVHEAKRGGDEVLKDHWQSQCKDPAVEAGLPAKIAEIHKMKFLIQNNKWNPCFVRACT